MALLAEKLAITQSAVSQFESGKKKPSQEHLNKISEILKFPIAYFYADDLEDIPEDAISFRSRRDISDMVRQKVRIRSEHASELISNAFHKRFRMPEPSVPSYPDIDPEIAARSLRDEWGLGFSPIGNMVHLLETKGIEVFWLNEPSPCLDGLSYRRNQRLFIFLNTFKESGERTRFDAAHELAHLVLHRDRDRLYGQKAEDEAHRFAAAFLMPAEQFKKECPTQPILSHFVGIKPRWGASVGAMVHRAYELDILTKDQYYRAFKDISIRGWRTSGEPNKIPIERSAIQRKIYSSLKDKGISATDFGMKLNLYFDDLCELTPIASEYTSRIKQRKNHLSLVHFNS